MEFRVDRRLALRYLGCFSPPDHTVLAELDRACEMVEQTAEPRHSILRFPIERESASIRVAGTALTLPGRDIAEHLTDCSECLLMCVTLGTEIDRLIRRWQLKDMAFAAILDACASSAAETLCERLNKDLRAEYAACGQFLTDRFSPGYGDLPLSAQKPLCDALDAPRRLGVQVSESCLLSPCKSVTAIIGISASPRPHRDRCAGCIQYNTCSLRKEGATCADP